MDLGEASAGEGRRGQNQTCRLIQFLRNAFRKRGAPALIQVPGAAAPQRRFGEGPGVAVPGSAGLIGPSNQIPGVFYYSLRLDYQSRSALATCNATWPSLFEIYGPPAGGDACR